MTRNDSGPKADLRHALREAGSVLLGKLDGLGPYDARRPLTPTGTNLLGLVKHAALVEAGYLGEVFGRPFPGTLPAYGDADDPNADLRAGPGESQEDLVELYRRVREHGDAVIDALPLDAAGRVPWWPADRAEVTLHRVLVHLTAELQRHAGHADIVRELIDGVAGRLAPGENLPPGDAAWWAAERVRAERAAREAAGLPDAR